MADPILPDPDFEALLAYIQDSRGLDFRGYKRTSLKRRITLRMDAVNAADFAVYQAHLEADPGEFEHLLNTVLINVTSFFRDADAWDVLRDAVIPEIIARAEEDGPIRVWSVGCASGEEPYSIAMLLADRLGKAEFCRRVKIYATDLDEEALKTARAATYSPRAVEGIPIDYLDRFFERTQHHYVFERDLRKSVIFGGHNVVKDAPISRIDLLVCRNLLIYLEAETQDIVLPRLHYALVPDGFLFLGKAETQLARSSLFKPVEMRHRIFAKLPQEWRRPADRRFNGHRNPAADAAPDLLLLAAVIEEADTALMVVSDDGTVTLANHAARRLLHLNEADIGRPFQDLPISYRPLELRGPIAEVIEQRCPIRIDDQEYRLSHSETLRLTIDIRPLHHAHSPHRAALLSFVDESRLHAVQRELEAAQENLENSIEELQSANEELETTNEELQSTNEELETTNEELQSTNEELETINEEARSSNEEMETVNEELRIHAEQASNYRAYLESVLRSLNGGIIVVDDRRNIQSWNRWCEMTWGVRPEEVIGTAFDTLDIGVPVHLLRDDMLAVQTGRAEQCDRVLDGVDRRGRPIACLVRVSGLIGEDNTAGVVLVMQDITDDRRAEDRERGIGRTVARAFDAVYLVDADTLRILPTPAAFDDKRLRPTARPPGTSLADMLEEIAADDLRARLTPVLAGDDATLWLTSRVRDGDRSYPADIAIHPAPATTPPALLVMIRERDAGLDKEELGA